MFVLFYQKNRRKASYDLCNKISSKISKNKTLQTEIKATKEKLDTLKEAAKQADQALADGKMSQDQYDALQREIAETEQDLKSLEQEYKNFGSVQAQQVAAVAAFIYFWNTSEEFRQFWIGLWEAIKGAV